MDMLSAAMIVNYHIYDRSVPSHTNIRVIIYYHANYYYTHLWCIILLQIEGFQFFDVSRRSKTAEWDVVQWPDSALNRDAGGICDSWWLVLFDGSLSNNTDSLEILNWTIRINVCKFQRPHRLNQAHQSSYDLISIFIILLMTRTGHYPNFSLAPKNCEGH